MSPSPASPAASPTPSATPSQTPSPEPPVVPATGSGRFTVAPGESARAGTAGRLVRYDIKVEHEAGVTPEAFAAAVEAVLADPRGWTARGKWSFQRVSGGFSDVTVHLATPGTTDAICARSGVQTRGEVSCRGGRNVVINLKRWQLAVPWFADAREEYRQMVVNHEMGHFLGHGHVVCPSAGGPAPVMQTQTFGLQGCVRNAWPHPDGHTYVTGPTARR